MKLKPNLSPMNLTHTKYTLIITLLLTIGSLTGKAQIPVDSVMITRDKSDVEGYTKGEELYATHHKVYGKANKIRINALAKLKKEAASKGYQIVLIVKDDFSATPINYVNLVGVGYKKD